jgi:hypothetical protein
VVKIQRSNAGELHSVILTGAFGHPVVSPLSEPMALLFGEAL